jgi:hypothetical protein
MPKFDVGYPKHPGALFGEPVIRFANNGVGHWSTDNSLSQLQKGGGWTADLYGGVQTGDDWAAVWIPVNELELTKFTNAQWSWYQTNAESMGLGMVIWVHDPDDFDKRADISQVGGVAGLDKAAGWNSHELDATVTQFFYYGENIPATTTLVAGTQYTLAEFQADAAFKNWTIYRISFDWGWEAAGTFESVYLAEVKLNHVYIQIRPEDITNPNGAGLASKTSGGPAHTHLSSGTLFNWCGSIEIQSIIGRVTVETEAAANTCKLSMVADALVAVDLCATKDLNHLHPGTLLHIDGTLANAMIATDVVGVSVAQAGKLMATCVTSGTITVTYGTAAKDGEIVWEIYWKPLSANGILWAA